MEWIGFLTSLAGGFIGVAVARKIIAKPKVSESLEHKYQWKCPEIGCFYEISSNDLMLVESCKKHHENYTHNFGEES